jgi:pyruvate ferredoxin oxidoreductase beta subunit
MSSRKRQPAAAMPSGAVMRSRLDETEFLTPGTVACPGCGGALAMRHFLRAMGQETVVVIPACCWAIIAGHFPYAALVVPTVNCLFAAAAAVASGIGAGLRMGGDLDTRVMAWVGDGGTYDIGLQSLSGALERNDDLLYVCYDNEAYMNTGIQRSSATPRGARTTTAPVGDVAAGKTQNRKDLTGIVIAHNPAYVAQASVHNPRDLMGKVQKALAKNGPTFINVLTPCHRGWRIKPEDSIQTAQVAVETCFWPLFEWEDGKYKINYKPKVKKPIEEWLKPQGRFAHLFEPKNRHILAEFQAEVDRQWERLLALEAASAAPATPATASKEPAQPS